jgi:hypothetical protein
MLDSELFAYLQAASKLGRTEFRLAVTQLDTGEIDFILHPLNKDGVTMSVTLEADSRDVAEAVDVTWDRDAWAQYDRQSVGVAA